MTEQLQQNDVAVDRRSIRIDVDQSSRQVRFRNRNQLTLLDTVSFSVSAGELVAIVGPSRAGKTTLLEAWRAPPRQPRDRCALMASTCRET